ncbi:MAG: hypothetical protein JO144_16320 [Actinobacteria bacterium]|nr:hypothetical protein [Actinomycetota bacterium]
MTQSAPTLDVCDAERARLSAAGDTIATTLVELDADSTRTLLATRPLLGETARRWQAVQPAMAELWSGHRLLSDALAAATALRGTGRKLNRDELSRYAETLFGDSIELSTASIPLTQRALLGPRQQSARCTPAQLLTAMEDAFDRTRSVLADVAGAWRWQLARLDGCVTEHDSLIAAAEPRPPAELTAAAVSLNALTEKITCDPLGTTAADFASTEAALARARAAITSAEEQRAQLADILAGADQLLSDIAETHRQALVAHAEAAVKIAGHQAARPTDPDPELATELARLKASGGDAAVGGRLLAWQRRARSAYDQARTDRDASAAPLAERSELRGRLDAYASKAARYGLAESAQLTRMAGRARDLLYTAPCDLPAARAAVAAYSNAVTAATTTTPIPGDQ